MSDRQTKSDFKTKIRIPVVAHLFFHVLFYCLCWLCLSLCWHALLCVFSSFAINLKRKRELVDLILFSYGCRDTVHVLWVFLTVPLVCLQCVIVVFPDHNHLLFSIKLHFQSPSTAVSIFKTIILKRYCSLIGLFLRSKSIDFSDRTRIFVLKKCVHEVAAYPVL